VVTSCSGYFTLDMDWRLCGPTSTQYYSTTLTNKNNIHKEIKSRLNLGSACYNAAQSFCNLSKKVKITFWLFRLVVKFGLSLTMGGYLRTKCKGFDYDV
jgi:hypothetical protein